MTKAFAYAKLEKLKNINKTRGGINGALNTPVYATLPPPAICSPATRDAFACIRAQTRERSQMLDTQDIDQSGPDMGLLEDWISRHDLAISLGVSEDTLWRWDGKRTGPQSIKIGRKVYYRRSAVRSWLEAMERARKIPSRGRR
jgi:predicted DNA-binding transcriptional regulator AlpA